MRPHSGQTFGQIQRDSGQAAQVVESLGRMNLENLTDETEQTGAEALWFGEISAAAKKKSRDLKQNYEVAQAMAGRQARVDLPARNEKVTEQTVKDHVTLNDHVRKAFAFWSQAEYEADLAESAKFTLARKHEHLQHLTGLLTQELAARGKLPAGSAYSQRPGRTPVP